MTRRPLLLGLLGVLVGLALVGGWWFADCPPPPYQLSSDRPYPVYVFFYAWHSAIAWEQGHLPVTLRGMGAEGWRDAPIVEFGWGDRAFFWGGDQSWLSIVRIIFSQSPSVIHVGSFRELPPVPYTKIYLDQKGLMRLRQFVADTFARDDQQQRQLLGQGHYSISNFYEAVPAYSLWHNCNHWSAQALHYAGVHLCPRQIFTVEQLQATLRVGSGD